MSLKGSTMVAQEMMLPAVCTARADARKLSVAGNELAKMERRCALVLDARWRAHLPKLFWW